MQSYLFKGKVMHFTLNPNEEGYRSDEHMSLIDNLGVLIINIKIENHSPSIYTDSQKQRVSVMFLMFQTYTTNFMTTGGVKSHSFILKVWNLIKGNLTFVEYLVRLQTLTACG